MTAEHREVRYATPSPADAPSKLHGIRAAMRWIRCTLSHSATAEDVDEWQDGNLTRRHVVARWCPTCGREKR